MSKRTRGLVVRTAALAQVQSPGPGIALRSTPQVIDLLDLNVPLYGLVTIPLFG